MPKPAAVASVPAPVFALYRARNVIHHSFLILALFASFPESAARAEDLGSVVRVGGREWMPENLAVTRFRNGDPIPFAKDAREWEALASRGEPAWCYPDFKEGNGALFGKLYNHRAVSDPRGVAPEGWEVASVDDWRRLVRKLDATARVDCYDCVMSESAGKALKSNRPGDWATVTARVDAASGLNVRAAGFVGTRGDALGQTEMAYLWTSTVEGTEVGSAVMFLNDRVKVVLADKKRGYSVRCIKPSDTKETAPLPAVAVTLGANHGAVDADVLLFDAAWDEKTKRYVLAGLQFAKQGEFAWQTHVASPFGAFMNDQLKVVDSFSLPLVKRDERRLFKRVAVLDKGIVGYGDDVFYSFDRSGKKRWLLDGSAKENKFLQVISNGDVEVVLFTAKDGKIRFDKRDLFAPENKSLGNFCTQDDEGYSPVLSTPDKNGTMSLLWRRGSELNGEAEWVIHDIRFAEKVTIEKKHSMPAIELVEGTELGVPDDVVLTRNARGQYVLLGVSEVVGSSHKENERLFKVWRHVVDGTATGKITIVAGGNKMLSDSRVQIKPMADNKFLIAEAWHSLPDDELRRNPNASYFVVDAEGAVRVKGELNLLSVTHAERGRFQILNFRTLTWLVKPGNKVEALVGFRGYSEDRDPKTGRSKLATDGTSPTSTFYGRFLITRVPVN